MLIRKQLFVYIFLIYCVFQFTQFIYPYIHVYSMGQPNVINKFIILNTSIFIKKSNHLHFNHQI